MQIKGYENLHLKVSLYQPVVRYLVSHADKRIWEPTTGIWKWGNHIFQILWYTECWGRVSKGFSPHPGLNCGPLDYETSVITTTPRKLRFSLEKKLQFSWFLHFSWNLVWFRSFKNLEQKMGAIFFLKWLKWIEPACFPPWKKFWNQILYYSFC